jgi:hypothetical protein
VAGERDVVSIAVVQPMHACAVSDCGHEARHGESVCDSCSIRGRRSVQLLTMRWLQLHVSLTPGRRPAGDRIARAQPSSGAPVSVAALDAMEAVEHLLLNADASVRAGLALPVRVYVGVRAGVNVAGCSTLLLAQWDRAMSLDVAGPLIDDLLTCRVRVDRVLGLTELIHRLPLPCPRCDSVTLVRYDGDAFVRCTTCGSSWSEAEYRHLVRVLADEQRARSKGVTS